MLRECLGNLNELLFTCTYIFNQCLRGIAETNHLKILVCFSICEIPVDIVFLSSFISKKHVLAYSHIGNECKFLMNYDDALVLRVLDFMELADFAIIDNIAFIGAERIYTAQDVHQR